MIDRADESEYLPRSGSNQPSRSAAPGSEVAVPPGPGFPRDIGRATATDPKDVMIPLSRRTISAGAGIAAVALVAGLAASPATASPATASPATASPATVAPAAAKTTTGHYAAAAGWLSTQFVTSASHLPAPSGDHFESKYGKTYYANYGENDDVLFALAAAKAGASKATVANDYLAKNVDNYADITGANGGPYDGSVGKLAVGDQVEGGTATSFGGYNLLATLQKDECAAGATTCTPGSAANIFSSISESFVLIAEARAGGTYAPTTAAKAYFASLQCASGGFTSATAACGSGAADIDATSYAIMAMQAMGTTGAQLTDAVSWLQGQQNKAGYWSSQGIANVDSTGLAASALQGVGADFGSARVWLRAQQVGPGPAAGALRYGGTFSATTTSATSPSVLGTAQGLEGLVDGSSLATLTATKSATGVQFYAPTAHAYPTEKAGKTYSVFGGGFAAGEKVRITRGGTTIATVTVSPGGQYHTKASSKASAKPAHVAYTITGLSSGLTAHRSIHLVR